MKAMKFLRGCLIGAVSYVILGSTLQAQMAVNWSTVKKIVFTHHDKEVKSQWVVQRESRVIESKKHWLKTFTVLAQDQEKIRGASCSGVYDLIICQLDKRPVDGVLLEFTARLDADQEDHSLSMRTSGFDRIKNESFEHITNAMGIYNMSIFSLPQF